MKTRFFSVMYSSLLLSLLVCSPCNATAQTRSSDRVAGRGETQFLPEFLRASGGPVIPIFEGWYPNPAGGFELSFGYFNVNTEEVIDIPLGPDNFIEPADLDGRQPSHFLPIPEGDRRYWGAFTIHVPEDWGSRDVVWTLNLDGRSYSVPGRLTKSHYQINSWIFPGRESTAPVLSFEAGGPGVQGPAGVDGEPLEASVGQPITLNVWLRRDDTFPDNVRPINLAWFKHQGPGSVTFREPTLALPSEEWATSDSGALASTVVTFAEPGEYVLRALAYNRVSEFEYNCCWTNGFIAVHVFP